MKINLRELARNPASLRDKIKKGRSVLLTARNEPFALVIPVNREGFRARSLLIKAGELLKKAGIDEQEALRIIKNTHE